MAAHFSVSPVPQRDLVRITLTGFFSAADVANFEVERARAHAQLTCAPNHHVTLCDASAMHIQSQDIVAAFTTVATDTRYTSRRLAVVTGSSLARMQTRRVTNRDTVAYFSDVNAAEAWLFS
jgi:hypothetical protein